MIINNLFMTTIFVFTPISLYLNYLTYINNLESKEKDIFLEFTLISILILIMKFCDFTMPFSFLIYNIPLFLSLRLYMRKISFILIIIILFNLYFLPYNFMMFICIYFSFYLIYYFNKFKLSFKNIYIYILFLLVEGLLCVKDINLNSVFFYIFFFCITFYYGYFSFNFIRNGNIVVDYNRILRELEHEKLLRSSISKLTHELKNPIAVCFGYLGMFNWEERDKAEGYLSIVNSEINRAKSVIDEFSVYGKLKKLDIDEMDICLLFEDIIALLQPLFKKYNASLILNCNDGIYIFGDYNKLKQVFINLLKNSLEARREDVSLVTKINVKSHRNDVSIDVIDNGIGMNSEVLKKISDVFFTTKENGTGVGVAYSKEVILLHGGYFNISSLESIGTKVNIILPKEKKSEDFNNNN